MTTEAAPLQVEWCKLQILSSDAPNRRNLPPATFNL
jgi:hypothetical protein